MSNKYQNGKIYKIVDVGYNKCYIGSTCEELCQRMARHTACYKLYVKGKYNKARSFELFDIYGVERCKIELIENYNCDNKEELRQREGHHIETTKCVNKYVAGQTKDKYHQDNYEHFKVLSKKHYEDNRDKYLELRKINHNENRERDLQRSKEHYQKHKDTITAKRAEVAVCGCGSHFT